VRVEIPINREALLEIVQNVYGLNVAQLEYLGVGMVSAYRVIGPGGAYFLKLFPDTPFGREAAARLEGEHALLNALRENNILERIPTPVRALNGLTRSSFDGMTFAVYEFIEGETLWGHEESVLEDIAVTLGRLHAGVSRLLAQRLQLPFPNEDFSLPFEAQLMDDLRTLERAGRGDRPGVLALRDLLLPRRDELLEIMARAKYFQRLARSRSHRNVVAHTDLHGGNLLLDPAGRLWALDWETARVAPAEHDLWMYHANLAEFLPHYEAARGEPCKLGADLFGFYFYRWTLEDLAVDVKQIVNDSTSDEQDRQDIAGIEEHIFPWWPHLERDLERMQLTLEKRSGSRVR
jgi:aminoglycoside phosphotransferase (APT) family kinase protein